MLQKIVGIIGVLAVAGVITMVALAPAAEGFFPDMFDFLKFRKEAPAQSMQAAVPETVTETGTEMVRDSVPAVRQEPVLDSMINQ